MKSRLALLLLAALAAFGRDRIEPTQALLDGDLARAETAWGEHADVSGISWAAMNACRPEDAGGWSDLATRAITINSACVWDAELLQLAVTHEYGHMLLGFAHSLDKRSVMYYRLRRGERILPEDLERLRDMRERERPTLRLQPE